MGARASAAAAMPASHHHEQPIPPPQDSCADGCCKKPGSSEPGEHSGHNGEMQCCRAMSTVVVEKAKPQKQALTTELVLSAEALIEPRASSLAPSGTHLADLHSIYLLDRVLRI